MYQKVSRDQVESLIREFLARGSNEVLREYAEFHHVLPLYADIGGVVSLRPDGEIVTSAWDSEEEEPDIESNPLMRLTAVVVGAKKFPELKFLIPTRPSSAVTCSQCDGTGRFADSEAICGVCGGLGWIDPKGSPPEV